MSYRAASLSKRLLKCVGQILPASISWRLYGLGFLTIGSLAVMTVAAMLYVARIANVVTDIRDHDVVLASASADIELLLERHRRIVESAPLQLDMFAINRDRRESEAISDRIETLLDESAIAAPEKAQNELDTLVLSSRKVLYLAANFAQAEAVRALEAYIRAADDLQVIVKKSRETSVAAAQQSVAEVLHSGRVLKLWTFGAGLIVLLVVLPLSVFIIRNVVSRINGITESMRRIAENDMTAEIKSARAPDEIGQMVRALDVFKRNAEMVLSNSREIERLNEWFQIALNNMARGLSMFDQAGRLLVCNQRYLQLYHLPHNFGLPGTPLDEIASYWQNEKSSDSSKAEAAFKQWRARLNDKLSDGEPFHETHELPDGRSILVTTQPLESGGWVDLHEDITRKRKIENQVQQLARMDTLTGLANRLFFQETLEQRLASVETDGAFALIWFDLDRFKMVNDTLGHPAGDELLKTVADRVREAVRRDDFVARLGGDEFAILFALPGNDPRAATVVANRIIRSISAPYEIAGKMVSVGVSIGIAISPEHGLDAEALIHNADVALYRAKSHGRGQCFVFNNSLEEEISERERAEADLRRALSCNEFTLHYQPILELKCGRVTVCEALMRWNHPQKGMVPPGLFIPLAEDTGLIGAMGEWALRQACRDARHWPEHVKVSVNIAATQFASTDVVRAVKNALQCSGLSASRLQLEVTETIMLKDTEATLQALTELRSMGVSIALDDFGTGYASLSYLRSFPFDKIKIDQCFVRDITTREDCFAIVKAIVDLARSLGMTTVAEGIETSEVLEKVMDARCDAAQGYYLSRPVSVQHLQAALAGAEGKRALAA